MGAPGVDEVSWLKPLRPDTRIRLRATVLETRPSNSRPAVGLVKFMFEMIDETDAVIVRQINTMLLGRRGAAA